MNYRKGFIVPLLLALIALVLIGGGTYVYSVQKNQENQPATGSVTLPQATSTIPTTNNKSTEEIKQNQAAITEPVVDTSNWKTYRNEKYGFEVKYPDNWKFRENAWRTDKSTFPAFSFYLPQPGLSSPNDEEIEVRVTKYLKEDYEIAPVSRSTPGVETVVLGTLPALKLTIIQEHKLGTFKWVRIYQEINNIEVGLLINNYTKEKDNIYFPIFNQILSTFKFTR